MSQRFLDNFAGKAGATEEVIRLAEADLAWVLPREYREYLSQMNGGEGFIGENYLVLWSADELAQFNREYEVHEYAPGLVLFGSDGGGEAFAFDTRCVPPPVVQVPFIGMELQYANLIAPDFDKFISSLKD